MINYSDTHKDIIEQCKKGDVKAQYRLYQLYSKAMFNICMRMMNSREEAEDVLQEAFADMFRKLHYFRYESSFGAWLKRIVINRCINSLKRKQADIVLFEDFNAFDTRAGNDAAEPKNMKLNVEKIMNALSKLADGYRVIFSLYMLEGYDHSEIADILDISESTSKSQYLRAKRKLKELLNEEEFVF